MGRPVVNDRRRERRELRYESWTLDEVPSIPRFLEPLRRRATALAGLAPEAVEVVLVTRYPAGAGIGRHRDAPMFGPEVVGLSLLAPARMRLRRRRQGGWDRWNQGLAPGSADVLAGEARSAWQHSIPAVPSLRYSITFRSVLTRRRASSPTLRS